MRYTKETLRDDLLTLAGKDFKDFTGWDFVEDADRFRSDILRDNPRILAAKTKEEMAFEEIAEYSWRAYESSNKSSGHLIIGRVPHLTAAGLYEKVAGLVGDDTLFDVKDSGNLLKMDKWARVVNDSWVLGGIHRGAIFQLASPRVIENLWNAGGGYQVVTAREIIGLLNFGYRLEEKMLHKVFVPDPAKAAQASNADVIGYDRLIKEKGSFRHAIELEDKKSPHFRLMAEIRSKGGGASKRL